MSEVSGHSILGTLPSGVKTLPLETHLDERGHFTEIFREVKVPEFSAIQWNLVRSKAGVLRGLHLHLRHFDYLVLASGACEFGLYDCRPLSPTFGSWGILQVRAPAPVALIIPPGVAHGFLFLEESLHIYAVSEYWDGSDELGCRYDDPDCGIPWSLSQVLLSQRDRDLPALQELLRAVSQDLRFC